MQNWQPEMRGFLRLRLLFSCWSGEGLLGLEIAGDYDCSCGAPCRGGRFVRAHNGRQRSCAALLLQARIRLGAGGEQQRSALSVRCLFRFSKRAEAWHHLDVVLG